MTLLFIHHRSNAPKIYLYDVLLNSVNCFDDHIKYLEDILGVLKKVGMQVNAKMSTWCETALEFLGFWVSCDSYQPLKFQVEALIARAPSSNVKKFAFLLVALILFRIMVCQHI